MFGFVAWNDRFEYGTRWCNDKKTRFMRRKTNSFAYVFEIEYSSIEITRTFCSIES